MLRGRGEGACPSLSAGSADAAEAQGQSAGFSVQCEMWLVSPDARGKTPALGCWGAPRSALPRA